jgi:acyl carrier protein
MYLEEVKNILGDVLSLGDAKNALTEHSALLGSIPELDSMAVVNLITALEEHFGISVDDDEISATTFETLGSLTGRCRPRRRAVRPRARRWPNHFSWRPRKASGLACSIRQPASAAARCCTCIRLAKK